MKTLNCVPYMKERFFPNHVRNMFILTVVVFFFCLKTSSYAQTSTSNPGEQEEEEMTIEKESEGSEDEENGEGEEEIEEQQEDEPKKELYIGEKISLDFQDADINSVLRIISDLSNRNLVIDQDVKGKVNIRLAKPIPWDQALDIILRTNGLGKEIEGDIMRIARLDTLNKEKQKDMDRLRAIRLAKEELVKDIPLLTEIIAVNFSKASELSATLSTMLSPPEKLKEKPSILVDERTNSLIIKEIPEKIAFFKDIIQSLDKRTPQVMIEAKIIETTKNFVRDFGIQWFSNYTDLPMNVGQSPTTGAGGKDFPTIDNQYLVSLPAPGYGSVGLQIGHLADRFGFNLNLTAMEDQGQGRILSSPRITTLDNKEAVIKSVTKIPYQTTDSETTTSTGYEIHNTVKFVDAGVTLTVTPTITPDEHITLKIKAEKSEPDWSHVVDDQPAITQREATTELIVFNGETTVIGGLYTTNNQSSNNRVPWLADVPILGWMFKKERKTKAYDELLIFIKPQIVREEQRAKE
ncbi:MAG: type IV pilus secretin PilQ [bacterium]